MKNTANNKPIKTALLKCDEYIVQELKEKIITGLTEISFDLSTFKDKRVVLKPNLLMPSAVEKAIITHPNFFHAVVQIVKLYGGQPVVAECPAIANLKSTLKKVGYDSIIKDEGVEIGDVEQTGILFNENGKNFKRFEISKAFFDADIIINLPKFKTHGITYITGAVKNLFGTIPGLDKSRWHTKASDPIEFSEMLLDLNEALSYGFKTPKQFLHIMDAIIGQEGEGPGPTGTPKQIGAIIIGENPIAVDYAAVRVVGLNVEKVHTITSGLERNLGISSLEEIDLKGDDIADMILEDFKPTAHTITSNLLSRWPFTSRNFRNLITEKPVPSSERCTLCYKCKKICPAAAIEKPIDDAPRPIFDYDLCIRCYCCMEICPEAAIRLKKGIFQRLLNLGH